MNKFHLNVNYMKWWLGKYFLGEQKCSLLLPSNSNRWFTHLHIAKNDSWAPTPAIKSFALGLCKQFSAVMPAGVHSCKVFFSCHSLLLLIKIPMIGTFYFGNAFCVLIGWSAVGGHHCSELQKKKVSEHLE